MMRFSLPMGRRRLVRLLGAGVLVTGGACMPVLLAAGSAQAAACNVVTAVGTPCSITGTLDVTAGVLSLTGPASLTWDATLSGVDQSVADLVTADEIYSVDDATASAAGWNVTVSATTFTNGASLLPDATTFSTNGTVAAILTPGDTQDLTPWTNATAPTTGCASGSTCVVPTANATTYPVAIVTAAATGAGPTPVVIYNATGGSGTIAVGGSAAANPVAWWLNVPADAASGDYTSTITMEVASGPPPTT
jgi:hypothetical protein